MTHLPTDPTDPYEARLAGRVREHSNAAIVPIDATAIAHAAALTRPRRRFGRVAAATSTFGRLGWIAAAALIAVAAIGGFSLGSGGHPPAPATLVPASGTTPAPTAVPTAVPTPAPAIAATATPAPTARPIVACTPADLSARVLDWTGAAGQRIADLKITNTSTVACRFPSVTKPELVDGSGAVLIEGTKAAGGSRLLLAKGASLTTMAEDGNYCGPDPLAPVSVAIVLDGGARVIAAPLSASDTIGLAPCLGSGSPAYITIQTWH
jgi:hypothetical protein